MSFNAKSWLAAAFFCSAALGCASADDKETGATHVQGRLTTTQARVLGFESVADWTVTGAVSASSAQRTEGVAALAVSNFNYAEVRSAALDSLGAVSGPLELQLYLPQSQPGQSWAGQLQVYVDLPSQGLSRALVGSKDLAGLVPETFNAITFSLPSAIQAALGGQYQDLSFIFTLNVPHGGTYLLDQITLGGSPSSGGQSTALEFRLPVGAAIDDVVLGASERLDVRDGVLVQGSADTLLTSAGTAGVELGADSVVDGDVLSIGDVFARERARVGSDVTTSGVLLHQSTWTVEGLLTENATLEPLETHRVDVTFGAASQDLTLDAGQSEDLPPSSLGTVRLQSDSSLTLHSGTYFFDSFISEAASSISLDTSSGSIRIFVRNGFTYRGLISGDPARTLVVVAGNDVEIDSPFKGTLFAPNAALRLSPVNGSGHDGAFFARSILAEANNPIRFVRFADWEDFLDPEKANQRANTPAPPVVARWVYPNGEPIRSFSFGPAPGSELQTLHAMRATNRRAASTRAPSAPPKPAASTPLFQLGGTSKGGLSPRASSVASGTGTPTTPFASPALLGPAPAPSATTQSLKSGPTVANLGTPSTEVPTEFLEIEIRNNAATALGKTVAYSVLLRTWGLGNFFADVVVQPASAAATIAPGESASVMVNDLPNLLPIKMAHTQGKADFIVGLHDLDGMGGVVAEPFGFIGLPQFFYNFNDGLSEVYTYSVEAGDDQFAPSGMTAKDGVVERYAKGWLGGPLFAPEGAVGSITSQQARDNIMADFPDRPAFTFGVRLSAHDQGTTEPVIPPEGVGGTTEAYDPATGPTTPCALWPDSFVDNGDEPYPVEVDAPEWHGLVEFVPASFARAELYDGTGALVHSGNLDAAGCFPPQELGRGDYFFRVFTDDMLNDGMRFQVLREEPLGVTGDRVMSITYAIYLRDPGTGFGVTTGEWTKTSSVAAFAGFVLARDAAGLDFGLTKNTTSPVVYDLRVDSMLGGGITHYSPSQRKVFANDSTDVWVSDARWKFVLGHEFGHMVQDFAGAGLNAVYRFVGDESNGAGGLQDPASTQTSAELKRDCTCELIEPGDNRLHCIQSIELSESAQQEGFGHFFAARLYNRVYGEAGFSANECVFNYYKQTGAPNLVPTATVHPVPLDCAVPYAHRDTACSAVTITNGVAGAEIDWLTFFWAITTQTTPALPEPVTVSDLLSWYVSAKAAGNRTFEGLRDAAPANRRDWLLELARQHGVDNPALRP